LKDLDTLANSKFDIPGDSGFPLNAVYQKPTNQKEVGMLIIYF
jgi:actin related protein 2/3 complex subunit 3